MAITYKTPEGQKLITGREITSVEEWAKAFAQKYQGLPASVAKAFAARDFNRSTAA